MFELKDLLELLKFEPGSGLAQTVLLAMIWWSSRGIKTAIRELRDTFVSFKNEASNRFQKIEDRISLIETKIKGA